MTWAEFQLRLYSYNRQQKKKMYELRELLYITYIAPHTDPKQLRGLTKDRFWNLEGNKDSDEMVKARELFALRRKEYLEKKKQHG